MASRIFEPVEELAVKLFRFSEIRMTAHVHAGRIHKIDVDLGGTKLSWTLEDVEQGKVALSLVE